MTAVEIIFKLLRVWSVFAVYTLLFSLLLCLSSYKIFEKAGKKRWQSFIPIYNLIVMLDIVKMNGLYFLLLLLPITNVLIIYIMLYRLSIVFVTEKKFALGLILCAAIFLPILNYSNELKLTEEEEKKLDDVSGDMISLLTNKEYEKLNNQVDDTPKVDNVFKGNLKNIEQAPTFKANKLKYQQIVEEEKPIKVDRVEPVEVRDLEKNKFVTTKEDEDDSIEIIEF
mgnify:FL=1